MNIITARIPPRSIQNSLTFLQKISAYALGLSTEKDLPGLAITGLEEGYDSVSLRILAGLNPTDSPFNLNDYFTSSLNELQIIMPEGKEALIEVVAYYARAIVEKTTDTYTAFGKLIDIINKTPYHCADIGLLHCYADYISIWEEKMGGLDFHTKEGITSEKYIEKTEESIRQQLTKWLAA